MKSETTTLTTPRRPGRPSKFTPETVDRVLRCVEKGMPLALAANAAGIAFQSLCAYRNAHAEFDAAVQAAIARGVEKRLEKIERASELGDWRASAWLLEHCQPEHFARNRLEVTGADGQPFAGAIAVYLPQKDGASDGPLALPTATVKEGQNGD